MVWPKGKTHSAETRAKMSEAKRGKTHSAETRAKMSEAQRGKTHSAETRAKISEAKRGKTHSAEARAKMSEAKRGPDVRGLSDADYHDFRCFRAKGFTRAEALKLVQDGRL